MAFSFPLFQQALDAHDGVIKARQFHPLFGVIASGPSGTINTDVPNVGMCSLSANNFHGRTWAEKESQAVVAFEVVELSITLPAQCP